LDPEVSDIVVGQRKSWRERERERERSEERKIEGRF
jgi:hypothetical protein